MRSDSNHNGIYYAKSLICDDTGYTAICGCGARFGEKKKLIGKPRALEMRFCLDCEFKRKSIKERYQLGTEFERRIIACKRKRGGEIHG